jgi:hypothetical protein
MLQAITVESLRTDAKEVVHLFYSERRDHVGIEIIAKVAEELLYIADMEFDGTWLQAADVSQVVHKTVYFGHYRSPGRSATRSQSPGFFQELLDPMDRPTNLWTMLAIVTVRCVKMIMRETSQVLDTELAKKTVHMPCLPQVISHHRQRVSSQAGPRSKLIKDRTENGQGAITLVELGRKS